MELPPKWLILDTSIANFFNTNRWPMTGGRLRRGMNQVAFSTWTRHFSMKVGFLFERWPVHRATISAEKSRENKTCKRHQETDERIGRPKSSEIFLDVSSKLPKTKVPDTLKPDPLRCFTIKIQPTGPWKACRPPSSRSLQQWSENFVASGIETHSCLFFLLTCFGMFNLNDLCRCQTDQCKKDGKKNITKLPSASKFSKGISSWVFKKTTQQASMLFPSKSESVDAPPLHSQTDHVGFLLVPFQTASQGSKNLNRIFDSAFGVTTWNLNHLAMGTG